MKKIAISIGDLNGIGFEIALNSHKDISKICEPIYVIDETMATWCAAYLGKDLPQDFRCIKQWGELFEIKPGKVTKESGLYSFKSFERAISLVKTQHADAVVTLPINKEAWSKANVIFKGHTDALSHLINTETIMMLGCDKLFTILYTHHIPLKEVSWQIKKKELTRFLLKVYNYLNIDSIGVLGLNPHAGDNGVIGDEDEIIKKAIKKANKKLQKSVFSGPLVPDTAFTQNNMQNFTHYICMYHDQGLIPLKTLYFDESINVTLNAHIIRTSVDHGTAFDIAYTNAKPNNVSYLNAIKEAIKMSKKKKKKPIEFLSF